MDTFLILLAVLGFGAILIAVYVFTVAARTYVSEQMPEREAEAPAELAGSHPREFVDRAEQARRQQTQVESFPLEVDGEQVSEDRREIPDRRKSA